MRARPIDFLGEGHLMPRATHRLIAASAVALSLLVTANSAFAVDSTPTDSPSATPSESPTSSPSVSPSVTVSPTATVTPAPDNFTPRNGVYFNYPFSKKDRGDIRTMFLRSVRSVPSGGAIRIAAFSINDWTTVNALVAARNRGVSVQIIADWHTAEPGESDSFRYLQRTLGKSITRDGVSDDRVSFARTCVHSCRYNSGNMHQKLFLFSQVGTAQWVTMGGSANMTMMASRGQWNHINVWKNPETYAAYLDIFNEMKLDRPQQAPGRIFTAGGINTWVFPRPSTDAGNDPMMDALSRVRCTGVSNSGLNGRTVIRIGMYSWYNDRGLWLAKKVRNLWDNGCNVAIEFAIMSPPVRTILYSPTGRGRIPMRQVGVYDVDGTVLKYLHHKYVAISGVFAGNPTSFLVLAGTTNFADLGMYSDEMTQRWMGYGVYRSYMANFRRVWADPRALVPSPNSTGTGDPGDKLGTGRYTKMKAD